MWGVLTTAAAACAGPAMFAQIAEPPATGDLLYATGESVPGAALPGPVPVGTTITLTKDPLTSGRLFVTGAPAGQGDEEGMRLAQLNGTFAGEIQQLELKLRDADDEEVAEEIEEALTEKVGQQFDVRQQMRERQLAALEEQVERLRKIHNERTDQRDRIVRDRVQQLIREAQGLGWGDAGEGEPFKMPWSADTTWSNDAAPARIEKRIITKKAGDLFIGGPVGESPAAK
jgi:hypothetical protein